MALYHKRTWAEIDLTALARNFLEIRRHSQAKRVMAMVKADAYGHGAVGVAKKLSTLGVDYFGVASLEEALELRNNGITEPILIMGFTPAEYTGELLSHDLTQTVLDYEDARAYSDAALVYSKRLKVHIKLDTGMGREGIVCGGRVKDAAAEALRICMLDGLYAEGIYTHFAAACASDTAYTEKQTSLFSEICADLEQKNIRFEIKHCANSAAVLEYPCVHFDMVRAGIILYGLTPDEAMPLPEGFRPVMSLKTIIAQVKSMAAGSDIGYGRTYTTTRPSRIAVLPIGYADGLPRLCSNRIQVGLHKKSVPAVGRICMDLCMIDVTDVPKAKRGDEVTIFGWEGDILHPVETLAKACETINYEIVTSIGKRVPRVMLEEE